MGSLVEEFANAYDHNFRHRTLNPTHETQINALKHFIDRLNEGGVFKARLDKAAEAAPVLKINDGNDHQVVFLITYHEKSLHDVSLVVTPLTTRQPLYGHAEGYNMTRDADRMQMMRDMGCYVAQRGMELDLLKQTALKI